jgi:hypothetical protein
MPACNAFAAKQDTMNKYKIIDYFAMPHDHNSFHDWIVSASPGSAVAYYRGNLAEDRLAGFSKLRDEVRHQLNHFAAFVMEFCETGAVHLIQRQMGPCDAIYYAVRAHQRRIR